MDFIMGLLGNIVNTFFDVILNVLSLLPMSPFGSFIEDVAGFEFLGYMNYFIPFQAMATVLNVYIAALLAYYVYKYVVKFTDMASKVGGLFT